MSSDERMAGVVMIAIGTPLLLLGLLLHDDVNLLIALAIVLGFSLLAVLVRVLWRRPRAGEGSPWWGLVVLMLVPIGFAAGLGASGLVAAGGLLLAEGIEYAARAAVVARH